MVTVTTVFFLCTCKLILQSSLLFHFCFIFVSFLIWYLITWYFIYYSVSSSLDILGPLCNTQGWIRFLIFQEFLDSNCSTQVPFQPSWQYSFVLVGIRIEFAVLDPDSIRKIAYPDPAAWELAKINKLNLVSCLSKRLLYFCRYVFVLLPTFSIFFL